MTEKSKAGEYVYNTVLSAIDYCGDIRKGGGTYSPYFSPNNIRRIILSPMGIMIQLHVSTKAVHSKVISRNMSMDKLMLALQDPKGYKPGIRALTKDRLCSSVEEIIICSMGNMQFLNSESDLSFLLRQDGKCRIQRLASVIQYNGQLSDFLNSINQKDLNNPMKLWRDLDFVKQNCKVLKVCGDDWYKYYGTAAQFYALDSEGSSLNKHFKKIIEAFEENKANADKDAFLNERNKGARDEMLKSFNRAYMLGYGIFVLLVHEEEGRNTIFKNMLCPLTKPTKLEVYKVGGIKMTKSVPCVVFKEPQGSEKDMLAFNKESCDRWFYTMYRSLCACLTVVMQAVDDVYPKLLDTVLGDMDNLNIKLGTPFTTSCGRVIDGTSYGLSSLLALLGYFYTNKKQLSDKGIWNIKLKEVSRNV